MKNMKKPYSLLYRNLLVIGLFIISLISIPGFQGSSAKVLADEIEIGSLIYDDQNDFYYCDCEGFWKNCIPCEYDPWHS